ncbi:MAG TPA: DUF455 family protein [Bdellovibrionales bacterium]|nr:DUF455 family protein [Bdellovibrionales bacterium]
MDPLLERDIYKKIESLEPACRRAFEGGRAAVPVEPGRDIDVVSIVAARGKPGLASREGQARLLHDLASIELQAMELAYRTLIEYPEAPDEFRHGIAELAASEGRHLRLCLEGIEKLGFKWGHWPVHLALWFATSTEDSLLDRLLIVHRYLEGGGLDAGATILRRLNGTADLGSIRIVKTIVDEEVGHVSFGSHWYRRFCELEGLAADDDFGPRLSKVMHRIPRRLEKLDRELRRRAGFTEREMDYLESLQERRPWKPE